MKYTLDELREVSEDGLTPRVTYRPYSEIFCVILEDCNNPDWQSNCYCFKYTDDEKEGWSLAIERQEVSINETQLWLTDQQRL